MKKFKSTLLKAMKGKNLAQPDNDGTLLSELLLLQMLRIIRDLDSLRDEIIRVLRRKSRMTEKRLANDAGLSTASVSRILHGKQRKVRVSASLKGRQNASGSSQSSDCNGTD